MSSQFRLWVQWYQLADKRMWWVSAFELPPPFPVVYVVGSFLSVPMYSAQLIRFSSGLGQQVGVVSDNGLRVPGCIVGESGGLNHPTSREASKGTQPDNPSLLAAHLYPASYYEPVKHHPS